MRIVTLDSPLPEADAAALAGQLMDESHYDILIDEEAVVYRPDGSVLLKLRRAVLPTSVCKSAWGALREAATPTDNRGIAAGRQDAAPSNEENIPWRKGIVHATANRAASIKRDGTRSRTNYAYRNVNSGIVGFFDRHIRFPYCRTTAYSLDHPDRFATAMPFIRAVDAAFQQSMPERYAVQRAVVLASSPDFTIRDTAFTTLTVNKNWQTAVHQDAGDLREGFG